MVVFSAAEHGSAPPKKKQQNIASPVHFLVPWAIQHEQKAAADFLKIEN
jgi:hypothetical protein